MAQESDFWKFLGAVVIPIASLALLGLAIGSGLRLTDYYDLIQRSAGSKPVFDILDERRHVVLDAAYRQLPTVIEPPPAEPSPAEPSPVEPRAVEPPLGVPTEFPPLVTAQRQQPPGRIEPAPLPPDQSEAAPSHLEEVEPAAGPSRSPRDLAAVPPSAPSALDTPMPEPLAPEPPVEPQSTELPVAPEPRPAVPEETRPGPVQPVSPQPVSPQPVSPQPVSPQREQPVDVVREPPPAEAAPEPPAAVLQATPAPRSGTSEAEPPQVAMLPPGQPARLEQLLPPGRGSGQKLLARLAATESVEDCGNRALPFFRVLDSNVEPERLPPGGRFSHRLVYALCPADPAAQLTATVERELRGSAGVALVDHTDDLRLRPGTWASDEDLVVPPNTDPGRYTVDTTVVFDGSVWTEQTDLLIE